jgi:hypothetical protein
LNHFYAPEIPFAAQYGADGPRITDRGPPFSAIYLQHLPHRSPEALRDAVAHLGSYIFHDVTTTLGLRLDRCRHHGTEGRPTPFRSFGTYAIWFPRGLMLRLAARQAAARLLIDWQESTAPAAADEVEAACARALADPELRFEALCARIEQAANTPGEGTPAEAMTTLLSRLEEQAQQSVAQDDPGNWAHQTLTRVRDWVGTAVAGPGADWRRHKLGRTLLQATNQVVQEWAEKLSAVAFALMELPGQRVAAAEAVLRRLQQFCLEAAAAQQARLQQQEQRTQQASEQLEAALQRCLEGPGGFSLFGGRSKRQLRVFMDHLAAFTRQRLAEEVIAAGVQYYALLQGKLAERLQDLTFCRQRLRHLQETFEAPSDEADNMAGGVDNARFGTQMTPNNSPLPSTESFWESIRESATVRVVLPDGETDLERAATKFLASLNAEHWTQLDQELQDRVLGPLGGLHRACVASGDLIRNLAGPLLDQAAASLGELLPTTDVAQVEFSEAAQGVNLRAQIEDYLARAAPLIVGKDTSNEHGFLLLPASDAGKAYGEQAKEAVPTLHLVPVPGQADLMFCREQGFLTVEDLQRLLGPCRPAYDATASAPSASPHARFDIVDWMPIDS